MKERELTKYLRKTRLLPPEPAALPRGRRFYTVIPACDELDFLPGTLRSLAAARQEFDPVTLVVVNHPASAEAAVRAASEVLIAEFSRGAFSFLPDLYWIFAPELTGGVGEARKLGMDLALAAVTPERGRDTAICSLDADSPVAAHYFSAIAEAFDATPRAGAFSLGVRHQPGASPEEERAIRAYEAYLNRYVDGLRSAGSPYAFQTIGSAFVVRAESYLRCGGMRVRPGGEDFYFLQAAAKVDGIAALPEPLVFPSARPSARVPFGTGPSVRNLMAGGALPEVSDEAFTALKQLLSAAAQPGALISVAALYAALPPSWEARLEREGFGRDWPKVLSNTPDSEAARFQAFHRWFDGLRTLKALHDYDRNR